jgi:hypothetical protein
MHAAGGFPDDAPASMRTSVTRGQLTPGQMIDRYGIACQPVRDLLVDYLRERQPSVDYSTLRNLAQRLGSVFWRDLELHHPGISSLHLPPDAAAGWKQRALTATVAGKAPSRATGLEVLTVVRAFYLDIAEWALEDPARWGPWAAPCPVRGDELARRKELSRRKARMDQRTRERLPVLPALVASADAQRRASGERLEAARAAGPGQTFTAGGQTLRRSVLAIGSRNVRIWADDPGTGKRRDLTLEEHRGFWSWAVVEVLRHTGIGVTQYLHRGPGPERGILLAGEVAPFARGDLGDVDAAGLTGLRHRSSCPAAVNTSPAGVPRAAVMRSSASVRCCPTARRSAGSSGSCVRVRWSIRDFTRDLNFFCVHSAALTGHGATRGAHRAGSSAAHRAMSS